MNSIFADKKLLIKEYKRLFLNHLSSLENLKQCLSGRYDKKTISDVTLKKLFTNSHKHIFNFIGTHNENRVRHFFGDNHEPDSRDNQIRLIDKLILDSIHFEIMRELIIGLNKEYSENKTEIDIAWESEVREYSDLGLVESIFIIQNAFKLNKILFYDDLLFSKQGSLSLFSLSPTKVIPDKVVFYNWIPEPISNPGNPLYIITFFAVLVAALIVTPYLLVAKGLGFGAVLGGYLNASIEIITNIIIVALIGGGIPIFTTGNHKSDNKILVEQDNDDLACSSYILMNDKMPSQLMPASPSMTEPFSKKITHSILNILITQQYLKVL